MRQGFVSFVPADLLLFIKWTKVQRQVMFFKKSGLKSFSTAN